MDEPRPSFADEHRISKVSSDEGYKFGIKKKYSDKLIRSTLEVWQSRSSHKLTEDDAKIILDNTIGLFRLLMKWDQADNSSNTDTDTDTEISG